MEGDSVTEPTLATFLYSKDDSENDVTLSYEFGLCATTRKRVRL